MYVFTCVYIYIYILCIYASQYIYNMCLYIYIHIYIYTLSMLVTYLMGFSPLALCTPCSLLFDRGYTPFSNQKCYKSGQCKYHQEKRKKLALIRIGQGLGKIRSVEYGPYGATDEPLTDLCLLSMYCFQMSTRTQLK